MKIRRLACWNVVVLAVGMSLVLSPAVGAVSARTAAPLGTSSAVQTYVAMGDSYSAGEGNPPFYNGSDVESGTTDACHRSPKAYPALLAAKLGLIFKFAACSGATTGNIWNSGHAPETVATDPEGLQIDQLSTLTKIVTISIGGNDLGFSDVLKSCILLLSCLNASKTDTNVKDIGQHIGQLVGVLINTYREIHTKAPNATIYVLGYPYVIPPHPTTAEDLGSCGVTSGLLLDSLGYLAPYEIDLDNAIAASVGNVASIAKIHYVNPNATGVAWSWIGHDICSKDSWVYPVENKQPTLYSFHPTAQGQVELAEAFFADGIQAAAAASNSQPAR